MAEGKGPELGAADPPRLARPCRWSKPAPVAGWPPRRGQSVHHGGECASFLLLRAGSVGVQS